MSRIGRPPTCDCGTCTKCRARVRARERYRALTIQERRLVISSRNPEKVRAADRARHERDRAKRLAAMARYQRENREALNVYQRQWVRDNAEKVQAIQKRWRERNPEKRRAHNIVAAAIAGGKLARQPCEVCGDRAHAHHDDYSKPLEVRWLCPAHHVAHHAWEREQAA